MASCLFGGHEIWWDVTADSSHSALAQLPPFVATRAAGLPVATVELP